MQFQRKHHSTLSDDWKCFRLIILGQDDGDKLQDDLNKLFQWSRIWEMEFNAKKCKVLRVTHIRSIDDRDYCLVGIKLNRVDVEKDLGVSVSHNLSWNNHVDLISTKAQRMLNVLYQTCRDINDISTKKLLFLLGFIRTLNMLAWYGLLIPNKTLTIIIWNKFNAGLQDSFLEGTILSRGGWQWPLILPLFGFPWSSQLRNLSIIQEL